MRGIVIAPKYILKNNGESIYFPGSTGIEDIDLM
ncbi:hypothetical protein AJ85_01035 [Alkalihalobacillus alcalophilus ATCC 27647 = CGMCC 1.3604]|uniref:Uncharacterized protein n=1 Tax=Alkalihalobacillus alcalophilus ATCC 27647 = CGMCC 1.3604 TaxID=1218173 RepID=A0A4V3X829_ALKAL|nr:hypothetical protein AJ85_01035 [Alkalihalobacillus alcalophilus ATCC 27647 = CGMCC 1.3604]